MATAMASESVNQPNRPGKRLGGALSWGALVLAVAAFQWPMVKGTYYRITDPPAPASGIPWRTDFDRALAEASGSGKPLLVDFSASWCPPCLVMKHDVWPDPAVGEAVRGGYVPVLLDVDDPKNAPVAERYGVAGVPAVLVVDSGGRVLRRGGYMSSGEAIAFLGAESGSR
ncbi:thioredoxin family protein [Planctomyces sp. SH-PL62]|uniref:thioredoxin family protein n=1 Tax=Planctomyces sp. SH-PL62 TaxID=1636152 RepID=UPI00078B74E6|nr:thioredoxin family protein [Planctomyces sp. SH-PL62]AMV37880.1 Thioredoxin-1 [Planctomyces sp. SH-PL62]